MNDDVKDMLADAAGEGIITTDQAGQLHSFFERRGLFSGEAAIGKPRPDLAEDPAFETEAPRFVRGFHDVLITIGIVIALVGLWGVGSFFAALPGIVLMAEILVRRQRLALPAVALTLAFVQWIWAVVAVNLESIEAFSPSMVAIVLAVPFVVLLTLFYWRYRVPLSLAMLFVSIVSLALAIVFYVLETLSGSENLFLSHHLLSSVICLFGAFGLFSLAMRYDLRDPGRRSRDSDIAFWLHLGTAPLLLYSMLSFIFLQTSDTFIPFSFEGGTGQSLAVVIVVAVFMLIGLVIDRRAFVTSGLLSLGFAIFQLFRQADLRIDYYYWVTILLVGFVVLGIGVGWPWFRRGVVGLLPPALQAKLPPLR